MRWITLLVLCIASYTDIRTREVSPYLTLSCILARLLELTLAGHGNTEYFLSALLVFGMFLPACIWFSMGGADALCGALIGINLGFAGFPAVITGLLLAMPEAAYRQTADDTEYALVPFLTAGYAIWLLISIQRR